MSDLRGLTLPELEQLESAVDSGDLSCPMTKSSLLAAGFSELVGRVALLEPLNRSGALAVLRAVLAERRNVKRAELDLVWTGPDRQKGVARDTAVIVRELFARAQREVIIGGCYFSGGRTILQPLHTAMLERGVKVTFCMDIGEKHRVDADPLANAQRCAVAFIRDNWYFGEPVPAFYFDPRTGKPGEMAKLHAKCIVVDDRWSLVTSANFTFLGQRRNIEAGVLIDDAPFSTKLARQWRDLIVERKLQRCPLPAGLPIAARVMPEGWADAEELLDDSMSDLVAALIAAGVPGPDDYGAELIVSGLTSEHTSIMHWRSGRDRVSIVTTQEAPAGVEGRLFHFRPDVDVTTLAADVARALRASS